MFDVTPVENQFILEYMAGAKGDYVKVYLYGLLCCYHPRKEMDIAGMSRELELPEDVKAKFPSDEAYEKVNFPKDYIALAESSEKIVEGVAKFF